VDRYPEETSARFRVAGVEDVHGILAVLDAERSRREQPV